MCINIIIIIIIRFDVAVLQDIIFFKTRRVTTILQEYQ